MKKNILLLLIGFIASCQQEEIIPNQPTQSNNVSSYLNPDLNYSSVTDVDGNEYATIQIGNQVWMAENLRTTKYCNGDPIPNVTDNTQWSELMTGAWSYNNNDSQYNNTYGKLYNWYALNDARNICPCNWHVPSDAEWTVLTDYLGGEIVAGGKMKSTGTLYWDSPNTDATNESGFSGLPGAYRDSSGLFLEVSGFGYWWSSSEHDNYDVWSRRLRYTSNGSIIRNYYGKYRGQSIRCIKD